MLAFIYLGLPGRQTCLLPTQLLVAQAKNDATWLKCCVACRGHGMKDDIWTYGTAKLLLLMACKEMVQRLEGTGVTCLTAWPGIAGQHSQPLHKMLACCLHTTLGASAELLASVLSAVCQFCLSECSDDQVSCVISKQICGACLPDGELDIHTASALLQTLEFLESRTTPSSSHGSC